MNTSMAADILSLTEDPAAWPADAFAFDPGRKRWLSAGDLRKLDEFSTLAQRHALVYRPLVQVVPGCLFEGYNILSAPPKIGKTILATQLMQAVACGTDWLGRPCRQGRVLVYALEENTPGVVRRERRIMRGAIDMMISNGWAIDVVCAPVGSPPLDLQRRLTEARADPYALVIIDTSARFTGAGSPHGNAYERGLETIAPLDRLGLEHHVAILGIHHDRQSDAEDWFEKVNGSSAITGSAQCVMGLRRSRGTNSGVLMVGPREGEEQTFALLFEEGLWRLDHDTPAEIAQQAAGARRDVLAYLWYTASGATLAEIVQALPMHSYDNIRQALLRLQRDVRVSCTRGIFAALKPVVAGTDQDAETAPATATPEPAPTPEPAATGDIAAPEQPAEAYRPPPWLLPRSGPVATFNRLLNNRAERARKPVLFHPYRDDDDVPPPLRLLGRGQGTLIHEGAHRWISDDERIPDDAIVHVLDKNAAYLAALGIAKLPMGPVQHYDGLGPAGQRGFHHLEAWPDAPDPGRPHPLGAQPVGKRARELWITTHELELAQDCDLQVTVLESLTAPPLAERRDCWLRLETVRREITQALYAARAHGDTETEKRLKLLYSVGISTLGESAANTAIWRPDWAPTIRSAANTNLWRASQKLPPGCTLVALTGTDEMHVIGNPWADEHQPGLIEGRRLGQWKRKIEDGRTVVYQWGERDARR